MRRIDQNRLAEIPAIRMRRRKANKRRLANLNSWLPYWASRHSLMLAALLFKGNPRPDEPLELAWTRAVASYDQDSYPESIREIMLYHFIQQDIPGNTPEERARPVFEALPPWLFNFTA